MVDIKLKEFLDRKVDEYNQPSFISADPVSIPHRFIKKEDIEIAGFFAAVFAWGARTVIINKATTLMQLMDNAPHQFIMHHGHEDLKKLLHFKHRTFNATDILYFVHFLNHHYSLHASLETAFSQWMQPDDEHTGAALSGFHRYFFSLPDAPPRTKKHIATPERGAHCKRLNMYLRWMVRSNDKGVDFGIWKGIKPAQLICPVDVHVARVARRFNLLNQTKLNWAAAVELTNTLKTFDAADPVKYDFALFGLGVMEKY